MNSLTNFIINPLASLLASFIIFINFLIVFIPFYAVLVFLSDTFRYTLPSEIISIIFIGMYFFTLVYILIDIIFSLSIKSIVKNLSEVKDIPDFDEIQFIFEETLNKFNLSNVKFLLLEDKEVNAYAVASFRKKYVVVTTGLLNHIIDTHNNEKDRRSALKGIIGHELSHLINWDFLPNLILISGSNVAIVIKFISNFLVNILINVLKIIPIVGILLSSMILFFYNITTFLLDFSFKYILHPIYLLFERYLGRLIEYRSDYQSTKALSWEPMYNGLFSLLTLNGSTYHSSFSTHPNTISRMLNIYNKNSLEQKVHVNLFSKFFGLFTVIVMPLLFINVNLFIPDEIYNYIKFIQNKLLDIQNSITNNINFLDFANLFSAIKNYSFNFDLILNVDHLIYLIGFLIFFLFIFLFNYLNKSQKLNGIRNLNTTVNTDLDILLYYAIQNNDFNSFIKILEKGANFNTYLNDQTVTEFSEVNNPKFLKYIKKIKKKGKK